MTTAGESDEEATPRKGSLAERLMPDKLMPDRLRAVDAPLLDELTDQFERTRKLLAGNPEEAAEAALDRFSGEAEMEARIAIELSMRDALASPERFPEAHRTVMRALEVLDREGFRNPTVPNLGPIQPIAEYVVEFVAEYIVKSYAEGIAGRLRKLYARRETQAEPGSPERKLLGGARVEMDRITPGFSGGGIGAPVLVAGGLALPLLASLSQYLGAIDVTNPMILWVGIGLLFVIFLSLSAAMLRGAAVAHHRSRLIMNGPLHALWETIGHAGNPPEDDSVEIATGALMLAALVWFVLPAGAAVVFFVF
jgi:hypothetical protein